MESSVKQTSIADYTYYLPEERIAFEPLPQRDCSKLLIYENGKICEDQFLNLSSYLNQRSTLFANQTKVIPARLFFHKNTGGKIEVFCLGPSPIYKTMQDALQQFGSVEWECMVGGLGKWKSNEAIELNINDDLILKAEKIAIHPKVILKFSWNSSTLTFAEILELAGNLPIPPYIKREVKESDHERYQTVYAASAGSVAAPTAGLHFTEEVINKLQEKFINISYLTLHVGAGTFAPVKASTMADHSMHQEIIEVSVSTIESIIDSFENDKKIVAVGTTTLRSLESIYWFGTKILKGEQLVDHHIAQWFPYQESMTIDALESFNGVKNYMLEKGLTELQLQTQLLIAPGYQFKVIDGLITNFHQPGSTLLLLVAALVGEQWKNIYEYALTHNFRFLSYGDSSLLWKN